MADPLSVAASIVGLVTAAVQVSTFLYTVIQKTRHAPESCQKLRAQVDDINGVLNQLRRFLDGGRQAHRSRTSLIMVEQVTVTLASCVTTFEDLKPFAKALESEAKMGLLKRAKWILKEEQLRDFQTRLETHKSSLTLMLTILTCQKQNDAEDQVDALRAVVDQIYQMNLLVTKRMLASDLSELDHPISLSQNTMSEISELAQTAMPSDAPPAYTGIAQNTAGPLSPTAEDVQREHRGFAFEELLMNSRAYRQAANNNSDAFSVMSAAGRTATWSMLSGLSLSEMSNIAILAIPVYATDLNDREDYNFEAAKTDVNDNFAQPRQIQSSLPSQKQKRGMRSLFQDIRNSVIASAEPQLVVNEVQGPKVFGVALVESIRYAYVAIALVDRKGKSRVYGHVPIVVAMCCSYLKKKAIKTEEVFARSGHAARVAALQKAFDTPERYGRNLSWAGYTIADVTSVLLRYLKSLPEPVIPYEHYEDFTAPFRDIPVDPYPEDFSVDKTITTFQHLIAGLPTMNKYLFLYIIDILSVTANHSEDNKMTPQRLVSIFQPSLLSRPSMEMDSDEHICAANAATFLVNQQRYEKFLDNNGAVAPTEDEDVIVSPTDDHRSEDPTTPTEQITVPLTSSPQATPDLHLAHTNTNLNDYFMGSISLDNAAMIANAQEDPEISSATPTTTAMYELSSVSSPTTGQPTAIMSAPDVSTQANEPGVPEKAVPPENPRSFTMPLPLESSAIFAPASDDYALFTEAERRVTR